MICINCGKEILENNFFCFQDQEGNYIIEPCCSKKCYDNQEYYLNKWMKVSPDEWIIKGGNLFIVDVNIFKKQYIETKERLLQGKTIEGDD